MESPCRRGSEAEEGEHSLRETVTFVFSWLVTGKETEIGGVSLAMVTSCIFLVKETSYSFSWEICLDWETSVSEL